MIHEFISESDFEDLPDFKSDGVAIDNKHAYKKVVINPSKSNISQTEPSPSKVIDPHGHQKKIGSSILNNINNSSDDKAMGLSNNLDKINNLVQKEIALGKVGVTREKAYRVISQALDARKWMDVVDEQGNVRRELVDDLDKQRWGAEMAIKMFGDMIERKEIEHDIGDRTLDRLRALSVGELKARAADILLGKRMGPIQDAEVV